MESKTFFDMILSKKCYLSDWEEIFTDLLDFFCRRLLYIHYLPFITKVIPEARKRGMGVIAMKVASQGHALSSIKIEDAFDFTLSQDVDLAIIGCKTPQEVRQNASIARNFKPLSKEESAKIENKTRNFVSETNFFKKGMD